MRGPQPDVQELLLDLPRAAKALGLTAPALRCLLARGRGPAVVRIGRRIMFSPTDLAAFVAANRVLSPPPAPVVSEVAPRRRRGRPTKVEQMLRQRAEG